MVRSRENHFEVCFISLTIGVSFTILIGMYSIIVELKDFSALISLGVANVNPNLSLILCKLKFLLLNYLITRFELSFKIV